MGVLAGRRVGGLIILVGVLSAVLPVAAEARSAAPVQAPGARVLPAGGAVYVPVTPCRLVNTRSAGGPLRKDVQRQWQVTGTTGFAAQGGRADCGVPAEATAVEASVSAVGPSGPGYTRLWPAGQPVPTATFVNYSTGSTTNTGTVSVSTSGQVAVRNYSATTNLVVDVQGYYLSAATDPLPTAASVYVPVTPCRLVDTRVAGGPLGKNVQRQWQVTGTTGFAAQGGRADCGVPAGATAVEASVSAVGPSGPGYTRLWPAGQTVPTATFVNYSTGSTTNTGTVPVSTSGQVAVRNYSATTNLVVDVQGYYLSAATDPLPTAASVYVPVTPCRLVDTRVAGGALRKNVQRQWQVTGTTGYAAQGGRADCGVPAGATAVEASVSAVGPSGPGYTRLWPAGQTVPTATFVNYSTGSTTNTGTVPVSAAGQVAVRNYSATTDLVIDVQGYYLTVGTGATTLSIATPELPDLHVGVAVQTVLSATGATGAVIWTATGLPEGLDLDGPTGVLSGTPARAQTTNASITASSGDGRSGSLVLPLQVTGGLPEGCAVDACERLDPAAGTVPVPAAAVTSVSRNDSEVPVAVELSAAAPPIATGQVLVIDPGPDTPSGLVVKVTGVTGSSGGPRTATVVASSLTDAYASGMVSMTGNETPAPRAQAGHGTRAAGSPCKANADVEVGPEVTAGLTPHVTMLWGKNRFGFGDSDVYAGTGGVKLFQVQLEGDLTYRLKGSLSAAVDCQLDVPAATVPVSLGAAGFLFFKLQPQLGLKATAKVQVDTTVNLHCSIIYAYQPDGQFRSQYCRATNTPVGFATADTGADITIAGSLAASLTYNEAAGMTGTLTASMHAGYHPLQHPIGKLDGKVTADLSACLACIFGSNAPTVTIAHTTLWEKTFHTWDTPLAPPELPLTITTTSLPPATTGTPYTARLTATGGTKPIRWTTTTLPNGLTLDPTSGTITGTPTTLGSTIITATATDQTGKNASKPGLTIRLTAPPGPLTLVSVASDGTPGNGRPQGWVDISGNGRYVAYDSDASNLVPGDTNLQSDVFMFDRQTSTTTRISVSSDGTQANGPSYQPEVSADGRYVAFISEASNLDGTDLNQTFDVLVYDTLTSSTRSVSAGRKGGALTPSISDDGRYIAYNSGGSDGGDALVFDQVTGSTFTVPVAQRKVSDVKISGDGQSVAYELGESLMVPHDPDKYSNLYVYDRSQGTTTSMPNGEDFGLPHIGLFSALEVSANGRYVMFAAVEKYHTDLSYLFVFDRLSGNLDKQNTEPFDPSNKQPQDRNIYGLAMTGDARYISFWSADPNLVPDDTNNQADLFMLDRQTSKTKRVSVEPDRTTPSQTTAGGRTSISADGKSVAFLSSGLFPSGRSGVYVGSTDGAP